MAIAFTDIQPFPVFRVYECLPVLFYTPFIHFTTMDVAFAAKIELIKTRNETDGCVELSCSFESERDVDVEYYRKKAEAETFSRTIAIGDNNSNCMMTPLPDNIRCQCITNRNVSCTIFGLTDENGGEEWKCAIPCNGIGLFSNVVRISAIDKQTGVKKPPSNDSTNDGQHHNEQTPAEGGGHPKESTSNINYVYICSRLLTAILMLLIILIGVCEACKNPRTTLLVGCQRKKSKSETNVIPVMKRLSPILISRYNIWASVKGKSRSDTEACTESIVPFSPETGDTVCNNKPEYLPVEFTSKRLIEQIC